MSLSLFNTVLQELSQSTFPLLLCLFSNYGVCTQVYVYRENNNQVIANAVSVAIVSALSHFGTSSTTQDNQDQGQTFRSDGSAHLPG